jgi:hypothetical protein
MLTFHEPKKKGNWLIFNNTTLNNIDLSDCEETIDGVCHESDSIEECINICQNASMKNCDMGYFIKTPKKGICVPLLHAENEQPYYRLRDQQIYPEMNGLNSKVFVNSEKHVFPPDLPNAIFYLDTFHIQNLKLNQNLGIYESTESELTEMIKFEDDGQVNIQFVPAITTKSFVENYMIVRNGDSVNINIPGSSYILRARKFTDHIDWFVGASLTMIPQNIFNIFCKTKKIGEPLSYDDVIYFTHQTHPLFVDHNKHFVISSSSLLNLENNENNIFFKLIPTVQVYYCDGKICKTVNLKDTERKGFTATYNNKSVSRNPVCWGFCDRDFEGYDWVYILLLILVLIVIKLSLVKIFWNSRKK